MGRGWQKWALVASVTVNLLVVGVVAGGFWGHERMERREPPVDFRLGPLGAAFSREDRAQMRQEAAKAGVDIREMRKDFGADMEALIATVEADPWDEDAVRRQLAQMRANADRRVLLGEQVMLQRLSAMSAEERGRYAERLRKLMTAPRHAKSADH
ncbi:periplasmic heavy metal sensor [Paenirhodobacter sp.]|uniref:periplasmic heavy metal sensor n=1 Tax=Paenirhodobacter sp. TaxID=1965326 RepID=UPI003B3FB472